MSVLIKGSNKKRFIDILKWAWLVIVIAAGIYYVAMNYQESLQYLRSIKIAGLLLSIFFIILSRLLNVDLIRESVKEVGWIPTWKEMFSLVSLTQLGKYIPGGVWQFAARFGAYKSNQLSVKDMGKAFFLENVWVVLGGAMGGLYFVVLGNPKNFLSRMGIHLSEPLIFAIIILSILLWLAGIFIFQRLMHPQDALTHSLLRTRRLFGSHFLMYLTMGVSFSFLFSSLNSDDLLFTVGGYILSYLAGYLAIFAPGGIGVREVVSVAIFAGVAAQAELAAITIVHRLLYTLIEFAMGLLGFLFQQRQKRVSANQNVVTTPGDDAG